MNLQAYLSCTTQSAFANALGVSQGTVSNWITGRVVVPLERCPQIEAVTRGKVSRYDLRPDFFGPAPGVSPVTAAPVDTTANAQAA